MARAQIEEWQRVLGVKVDGDFGDNTLRASLALLDDERVDAEFEEPPPSEGEAEVAGDRPLHLRALDFCLAEAERCGQEPVSLERRMKYFSGCVALSGAPNGAPLIQMLAAGKRVAFCAAAQGFAEKQVAQPGEELPPWRSGAQLVEFDAVRGNRPGQRFQNLEATLRDEAWPHPGAIAVYHNNQSSTRGHVERVIEASAAGFRSVGANENAGRWHVDDELVDYRDASRADGTQPLRLVGFVVNV